ncbi:hypothetical protein HPP92_010116 [Vanilla planifolia]|uniref:Uncharacterized protein n=1 Tax=Vanilla planifolia TaxID=51239 RepID=A0A835V1I6_VANPL|nr:hypothetical protein HPP92_010452 [Vanilla planifolia]KAG0482032.1 hypothetical protein HPP92_010116 [Vanilla planifolia]
MASINLGSNRYDNVEQYYENGFHNMFGSSSSGRALHRLQDGHFSQVDLSAAAYANGQVDGMVHGQWPYGHVDVPILNPAAQMPVVSLTNTSQTMPWAMG